MSDKIKTKTIADTKSIKLKHKLIEDCEGYIMVSQDDISIGDEIIDITDRGQRLGMLFLIKDENEGHWITGEFGHHVQKKYAYKVIGKMES